MKLNLDKNLLSLGGEPLEGGNMAKILANTLANSSQGNVIKFYDWAVRLYNEGEIEVDRADMSVLKQVIESNQNLTILAKAQLLAELDKTTE